jgi:hypothetical protein
MKLQLETELVEAARQIAPILRVIDSFLSDNPSWDKGWSGYLAGKNSTQGGDR